MWGTFFGICSEFGQKFITANAQIWIFLKNFKCNGIFLSFSFDFLLYRASNDVFTGFPTRSVQELWLIKGLPVGLPDHLKFFQGHFV